MVKEPDVPPPGPLDERLRAFYARFVPEKADEVDALDQQITKLVKAYGGKEGELNEKLRETYQEDLTGLDKPDTPPPPPTPEPEEDDKKKKGKGKDKKGKKGKKDDEDDAPPQEPAFDETQWSIVEHESGRLLQCQLWQVIPSEEEPEEGQPQPEPERRLQPLLIPEEPPPPEPEGEGESESEGKDAEEGKKKDRKSVV